MFLGGAFVSRLITCFKMHVSVRKPLQLRLEDVSLDSRCDADISVLILNVDERLADNALTETSTNAKCIRY
jgi:hypothetical protein